MNLTRRKSKTVVQMQGRVKARYLTRFSTTLYYFSKRQLYILNTKILYRFIDTHMHTLFFSKCATFHIWVLPAHLLTS